MTAPDYADLRAAAEQMLRHTHTDTKRDWLNDRSAYEQAARPETILALLDAHDTARADGLANGADLRAQLEMALATMEAERDDLRAAVARVSALVEEWAADKGIVSPDSRYTRDVLVTEARAALEPATDALDHDFLPVNGHSDDDECTHRSDGTDATYCGQSRLAHVVMPRETLAERIKSDGEFAGSIWRQATAAAEARVLPLPATVTQAVAEAQNVPFAGTKQRRIADAVLALFSEQPTVETVRREAKVEALREVAEHFDNGWYEHDDFANGRWSDVSVVDAWQSGSVWTDFLRAIADRIASGGQG